MRRVDYLITEARRIGKNDLNPDNSAAISDEEILRYMNDAEDRIQGIISHQNPANHPFMTEKIVAAVGSQDGYSINDRIFYNKEYAQIEYSVSGLATEYTLLRKQVIFNRDTNTTNYPSGYYIRFGKFYPIPVLSNSQGSFRVMYERLLDDLDKRRGTISVVTGLTSTSFTSITLGTDADETSTPNLTTIDYICINDADGNVKAYNIPVLSYNSGTNVLTPKASFAFQTGETISVGDYVTFGQYTTTHSKLPDNCERYLIHYAAEAMLHKDSSEDVVMQSNILTAIEDDIRRSYASQTPEIQGIPQIDFTEWW